MKNSDLHAAAGSLLISEPLLADGFFKRSVVLVSEHDTTGALGFILNKLTDVKLNDAVDDFPVFDAPLFFGGPVDTDTLFYIHTMGHLFEDAKEIIQGVYLGGDYDRLKFLIDTKQINNKQIRFYAGYSGWSEKQLEREITQHSWMLGHANKEFTFYPEPEILWSQVLRSMKNKYSLLANFPDDPTLN
jgi:putative transcriptional regulator